MHIPDVAFHESRTLEEAAALRTRYAPHARVLAGGTDLLVDLKSGRAATSHLISISRIDALRGVSNTEQGLRIGALTTITQLDESALVSGPFAAIRDATGQMAAPQIRNMATVGGNIASAVPCADLPPILTAMNASVLLWSPAGERQVPLEKFIIDVRRTAMHDDEMLTAVLVPSPAPGFGAAYARFALRDGNGIAVAAVAASLQVDPEGSIRGARLVLGAVAPIPKRAESAARLLVGQSADGDLFERAAGAAMEEAEPISDVRGSAEFRRDLVGVLARRALRCALRRARESDS